MQNLDVPTARWLTSPAGLEAVTAATSLLDEERDPVRAATAVAAEVGDPARRAAVLDAAEARRRARDRWHGAEELLFTREALEQASDPSVAAHRAARLVELAGPSWTGTVVDLTAGVGGDALALAAALAPLDGRLIAVDLDPARLVLLSHNAEVRGVRLQTVVADALTYRAPPGAVLHADPARRRDGRRVRRLTDHLPSIPAMLHHHREAPLLALAVSPGVEPDDPGLRPVDDIGAVGTRPPLQVEYLQRGQDLVEATVWVPGGPPERSATLLSAGEAAPLHRSGTDRDRVELPVGPVGTWLVEVAPAAVRARAHDTIGAGIGASRIAHTRALLTTDQPPPTSPWYRAWPVLDVLPARTKLLRRWLADRRDAVADAGGVEVVLAGVETDPDRLWRDLGRPARGPRGLRLVFVRRDRDTVVVVTASNDRDRSGRL